ncbi:gamma-aminobutyric acid type B receptor subunit 1 isoform X3 [Exaiptasia diaphana]|nr:gamma-aminobutyric acid type B receptor subunit 1 isoform X3 [Exaiptasia diaphana]XP_020897196.1 gamma-aminobutyric acid type B receptor subunit 1 isoform X3 [Exaiptasia diaphana]
MNHVNIIAIIILVIPVSGKQPLFIGGFFPMSSMNNGPDWTGGNGIQPAAEIAIEHVNNRGVLRDYELKMDWNDTKGSQGWTEHLLFKFISTPPRKVMFLGAGYSKCSTVMAAMAGLKPWRIPQISYSSTSPQLSDKTIYPYFYRTIPDDTSFNKPRITLLQTYNWTNVAILYHDVGIHRAAVEHLQEEMKKEGIHEIAVEGFRDSASSHMASLKKKDARIIFGNFFGQGARRVFCEAYKREMYGPRYLWLLLGYIEKNWWLEKDDAIECTAEQMLAAANYHLATDYLWQARDNLKTVSGKTVKQFFQEYNSRVPVKRRDDHSSYAYDAVWAMALALNRTLTKMPEIRLDQLAYGQNQTIDLLIEELDNSSFTGITGPVAFTDKRNRAGDTRITQFIGGKHIQVGLYVNKLKKINWTGYNPIVWQGDSPPADRMQRMYKIQSTSLILYVFMIVVSSLCIIVALFFLWFNTKHRQIRFIKMSSPNLNNVIILGCIVNYISVVTFGLDGGLVNTGYDVICASRAWVLSLGFSLAYGAMFSKTWRVHTIFTNRKLKGKIVKDHHLFAVVFALVLIDVSYLTIWQVLDPLRRSLYITKRDTQNLDMEVISQIEYCESVATYKWLGILFAYKGLLLLFGAFLAWETRKVTITALNDSKHIGFSVYNVFVLCVVGAPMSLALKHQPDASFAIVSTIIIFATSLTIGFVFIPKVTELRKLMTVGGDTINRVERTFTVESLGHQQHISTINTQTYRELQECKNLLAQKEQEIKDLRKRLNTYQPSSSSQEDHIKQEPSKTPPPNIS